MRQIVLFPLEQREASPAAMSGKKTLPGLPGSEPDPSSLGGEEWRCRRWLEDAGERGPELIGSAFCSPHQPCVKCKEVEPLWEWFPRSVKPLDELYSEPLWWDQPNK